MGLRQLGHALSRLSLAGCRPQRARADRRCGARPPADRLLPERGAAHPLGRGRRLRRPAPLRRGAGDPHRRHQPELVPRRSLRARQPLPPRSRGARARARALQGVRRGREGDRLAAREPVARRRHQLPRAGQPARPLPASRRRPRAAVRDAAARSDAARRVQVLRAGLLQHRPARLGHGRADVSPARPAGEGARRPRTPPAGHQRRADRRDAARGGSARRLPLQQSQVRRRRPHRGCDRSVRAVQDHARDRTARHAR